MLNPESREGAFMMPRHVMVPIWNWTIAGPGRGSGLTKAGTGTLLGLFPSSPVSE